jgi:hypothetical protein
MKWWDKIKNYEKIYNELNFYIKKCKELEETLHKQNYYYEDKIRLLNETITLINKVDCMIEDGDYFSFEPERGTHGYAGKVRVREDGSREVIDPCYSEPIKLNSKTFRPYALGIGGEWKLIKKEDNQVWDRYTIREKEYKARTKYIPQI